MDLFRELRNKEPIRLLGIRTSKLCEEGEPEQLTIFDFQNMKKDAKKAQREEKEIIHKKKQEKLDQALDKIRLKYGDEAVVRGGQYAGKERNEKNHPVLKGH